MSKARQPDRDLTRELQRHFKRRKAQMEPELIAQAGFKPHLANEEMRNILIAQDVLQPCLQVVMEQLLPFAHMTAMELAIRLASYALSTAPMEDQAKLVSLFMEAFPNAHDMRLALGIVIPLNWEKGTGEIMVNHPDDAVTEPKGGI